MTVLWNRISSLGEKVSPPEGEGPLYLVKVKGENGDTSWLDDTNWLVGQRRHLRKFARGLRANENFQDFMSEHRIRIGLRKSDVAPTGKREKGTDPLLTSRAAKRTTPLIA